MSAWKRSHKRLPLPERDLDHRRRRADFHDALDERRKEAVQSIMAHAYHRGLGVFYVKDQTGTVIDCDSWSNLFNSACWGVFGGSTGTPVTTTTDASGNVVPSSAPDCTQLENFLNGSCVFPPMPWIVAGLAGLMLFMVWMKK